MNHLDRLQLAIAPRRNRRILAGLGILLLAWAWYDGGERPLREVVQPVAIPEAAR